MGGVEKIGACDGIGVEKELLTVFQRLAKYPGVEVNDFVTLSVAEKELDSILELTAKLWHSDVALEVGKGGNSSSISLSCELLISTTMGPCSIFIFIDSTSWELPSSS